MTNPFEDEDYEYLVLTNEGQYSIRPATTAVPNRRQSLRPADSRQNSLDYLERH